MRPTDEELAMVKRLGKLIEATEGEGVAIQGAEIERLVSEAGGHSSLAQTLGRIPTRVPVRRWVALGVLAEAAHAGRLTMVKSGNLIAWDSFKEYAVGLGLEVGAAQLLYMQANAHWQRLHPLTRVESRVATYLALHENGITSRRDIMRLPYTALGQVLGISPTSALRLREGMLRDRNRSRPLEFVLNDQKWGRRRCCPPLHDPCWEDRFDYFGTDSRLSQIIEALKQNISDRIREIFAGIITPEVMAAADAFGVGNASLYDTRANQAPFYGSGETIQGIRDLVNKTTQAEAKDWLLNIRAQLEQVRAKLRISSIGSWIWTGGGDDTYLGIDFGTCGGDGESVYLDIMGIFGSINVRPTPTAGGFPVDVSNYNDGGLAVEIFGSNYDWETPIPFGDGTIPALDVTGFRLYYESSNDWFFDRAQIYFRYEVNGHSSLLTDGQTEGDEYQFDLVHDDQSSGWVYNGDSFDFGIQPTSRLARTQQQFWFLSWALSCVEASLNSTDFTNVYVMRGKEIVDALREAAVHTRESEHQLARACYANVLNILSGLDQNQLGTLDRELLFAVHVLIAASYVASNLLAHAYASYLDAADFGASDAESRRYLWHALASLFLRWGDQLYAAAGGNYEARLVALDRYRKVTDAAMDLTYSDGREDEVLDLWLDLSRPDGAVPAHVAAWTRRLTVRVVSYSGSVPVYSRPVPIMGVEVSSVTAAPARGRFVRIRLDVSEVRQKRSELNFVVGNVAAAANAWCPNAVRLQARVASYNPAATPSGLRGAQKDILVLHGTLAPPAADGDMRSWSIAFAAAASTSQGLRLMAPHTCAARLIQRTAQLRTDQIRAHLNVYGVHDEYVPNGRFLALVRLAQSLADRSVYFWSRYTEFLAKAEAAALEEMDAAFLVELEDANLDLARERVAQADIEVDAALANVSATATALNLASQTLSQFEQTYQIGLLRVMNSINVGLWPPGVGMNLGGYAGSLSGADGYDAQFQARDLEYQSAVERARAGAEAAEFHRRLAEVEKLIATDSLAIEELRSANVKDRLDFLRNRTLSATAWYEMARLYHELAETKVQTAARWVWMTERALEFELNVPVNVIRMDYHLLPLGAERLRNDLDQLSVTLADFRDRYRDVPNIIEREFRFSTDFPQQFRALTSQAAAPPAISLGNGVRAVEFRTPIAEYDSRLPGRYAFGRILGIDVELQTDVANSVFTGHLENAREVTATVDGVARTVQVSESLVRVPVPEQMEYDPFCIPRDDLENSPFPGKNDGNKPLPYQCKFELDQIPQEILDLLKSFGFQSGLDTDSSRSGRSRIHARSKVPGGKTNTKRELVRFAGMSAMRSADGRFSVAPSLRAKGLQDLHQCLVVLDPLTEYMLVPWAPADMLRSSNRIVVPDAARLLLSRAQKAGISRDEIAHMADSLFSGHFTKEVDRVEVFRLKQVAAWRRRFADRNFDLEQGDLRALLALRGRSGAIDRRLQTVINATVLDRPGKRTWERYHVRGEMPPEKIVFRDVSLGHGDRRLRPLDILPDYLTYPADGPRYGLRLKRHDADSLTLSAYRLRDDFAVFNPYNAGDQLGVFENTGIDSDWRLTLRALPGNRLNTTPQWDKIREIIMRVWYHAAYERVEGYRLATVLEPQIIRWNANKTLSLSLYRDFYDEFITLLGDYDEADPASLAAVRSFTDESHATTGGWIPFTVDEACVPASGQRIAAAAVVFTAPEPSVFPAYVWQLRRDAAGPIVQGTAIEAPGSVTARLSAAAPLGFGGLEARGTWYLRLARVDNPGVSLRSLRDIEIIFELEPR